MSTVCLSTNGTNHFTLSGPVRTAFVATTDGVLKIARQADGGWSVERAMLEGSHISALTRDPATGGLYAAQMPGTLMFSPDEGATWEARAAGIAEGGIYSLRCYRQGDASVLYLGTQPVGLYRSTDEGRSWQDLASVRTAPLHDTWRFPAPGHEPHLKTLAVDPRNPDILYAGVEQGALLKSVDGGRNWSDLDEFVDYEHFVYKDIHQVMLRPTNADELFITTGLGIFHSANGGVNWEQLTGSDFRIGYPDQLLFAPDDDSRMFVSGGFATPNFWVEEKSAKGTVMLSENGGRDWRAPRGGFPEGRANVEAMTLCAHPGGYDILAGTSGGEIFLSSDGGENWTRILSGIAPVSKPTHDTLIEGVGYGIEP